MKPAINQFDPCKEGLEFYNKFNSFKEAWETCPRGDWMLWIAFKLNVSLQTITLTKALCANTVRHLIKNKRSKYVILIALKFGRGKATKLELTCAANDAAADAATDTYAAAAAATDTYVATAADAADAAAYAAYAAAAAAYAAYAAAAYAAAAYAANAANAAFIAKKANQLQTANICRKYLTKELFKILNIS
jgi:hypothetical protein